MPKSMKFLKAIRKDERGITGLETAIILIAFVVVAAVFAYTTLSSGLFATQKSKEVINSGLEQAQSTIELKGGIIAKAENTGAAGYLSQLSFTIANAMDGEAIDFTAPSAAGGNTGVAASGSNNRVVISYIDASQRVEDLYWTVVKLGNADSDNMLDPGEKFQITIGNGTAGAGGGNLVDALSPNLVANTKFTIEVKTPKGAVLTFERTTPANIDAVSNLD